MKLLSLAGLTMPITLLAPLAAGFTCFPDGQPFNEDWKSLRVVHACEKAAGQYAAGESFHTCAPMGDDKVIFSFKNRLSRPSHLSEAVCVDRVHRVIAHCGGHSDGNHGGFNKFEVFRIG